MSGPEDQKGVSASADRDDRDRLSAEFHAAADDLKAHLDSLPKAAAAVLPAPRRVEARAIPAPASEAPAQAREAGVVLPAEEQRIAAEAPTSAYDPPIVAHRLGAGPDSTEASPEAPEPAPIRARRRQEARLKDREGVTPASAASGTKKRRPLLREFGYLCVSVGIAGAIAGLAFAFLAVAPWPEDGADLWAVNRLPAIVIEDRNGAEIAARIAGM